MTVTVFIVEDNKLAAASLVELLTARGGVQVLGTAGSENEAAEWLVHRSETCDLLITDLLLVPGGSGFGILNHARNLGAIRHVAVFSNFVTPAVAERCRNLGADVVFLKSELDLLLEYVRSLQDGRAAEASKPADPGG